MKFHVTGIVAVGFTIALLLSSCSYFSQFTNRGNADKLRTGMTKQEVLAVMGEPLRHEKYNTPDVWYYYIDTRWQDCEDTKDECLPLVFKDGRLIGWGNEYYNRRGFESMHVLN